MGNLRCYWYGKNCTMESTDEEKITNVFHSFDINNNGKLHKVNELLKCLPHLNIPETILKKVMEKLDTIPRQEIDQGMFKKALSELKTHITNSKLSFNILFFIFFK